MRRGLRAAFCLSAALVLSGCLQLVPGAGPGAGGPAFFADPGAGGPAAALSTPRDRPAPPVRAQLVRGEVVVAGPSGYCVDPETLGRRASRSFAVIASCRILSGGDGPLVAPMVLTITVGARGSGAALPDPQSLAAAAGGLFLSGANETGLVVAHLADDGTKVLDGGDARHWRGAFVQNGRLVALALYAPEGTALAGDDGLAMLRAVRDRITALSPEAAPTPTSGAAGGVFERLFNPQDLP